MTAEQAQQASDYDHAVSLWEEVGGSVGVHEEDWGDGVYRVTITVQAGGLTERRTHFDNLPPEERRPAYAKTIRWSFWNAGLIWTVMQVRGAKIPSMKRKSDR